MNHYPTNDGFKDEREENVDNSVYGWEGSENPCPECGGELIIKVTDYEDISEIEHCCMSCEYYEVHYE